MNYNYRLRNGDRELGIFAREELLRKRMAGELLGTEWVLGEGMSQWQTLDVALQTAGTKPPPLPGEKQERFRRLIWVAAGVGGIFLLVTFTIAIWRVINITQMVANRSRVVRARSTPEPESNPQALAAASKPVTVKTNCLTEAEIKREGKDFRIRQWLDAYKHRGSHNAAYDAEATQMIQSWIEQNYGSGHLDNLPPAEQLAYKLAAEPGCDDPLLLTVIDSTGIQNGRMWTVLDRAVQGFENSTYRAYPKFYAATLLASRKSDGDPRRTELEGVAMQRLGEAFADGSFVPADQANLAEIFIRGWGKEIFARKSAKLIATVQGAGKDYQWLALVLSGESHINDAWAARGGDYADKVTEKGWEGFNTQLKLARSDLSAAWKLQPDWGMAPERMISVCLGDSDITEMRLWFDRAVTNEIDRECAWSEMRWGLRPRWFGDEASMLAFGVTALNTGRFDTDTPRQFFESISDIKSEEEEIGTGQHIYGRPDIWPHLQKMYEGYLGASTQPADQKSWRTAYACVAYSAGKFDVARAQFEAIDWKPTPSEHRGWDPECYSMMQEVMARTGSRGGEVTAAEAMRDGGNIPGSLSIYTGLEKSTNLDARTRQFVQLRAAALQMEKNLQDGQWVDFQPKSKNDPNWFFQDGHNRVLSDGALEITGNAGEHLFYPHVPVGGKFEIRGTIEMVCRPGQPCQAGVVMGKEGFQGRNWDSFRIRRYENGQWYHTIGLGFTSNEIVHPLSSTTATNTFDFTYRDSVVTALINGREEYSNVGLPTSIQVPDESFVVGLGGYFNDDTTVIRYRNIQLRRITPFQLTSTRR